VWFGAVIRADGDKVTIGARTNIQDNSVVHVDPGFPVTIGNDCIIGHLSIIHGATLGNHVLVGMHSTIMNGVEIGDFCIIGANALITTGTKIPSNSLVMGSPAKVIKQLNDDQIESIKQNAKRYVDLKNEYLDREF
jgi:carbonic anhydrase/acetyltransferase-like protein (isoleucine patch superfamily)